MKLHSSTASLKKQYLIIPVLPSASWAHTAQKRQEPKRQIYHVYLRWFSLTKPICLFISGEVLFY